MDENGNVMDEVYRLWLDILRDEEQKPELRMKAGDKLIELMREQGSPKAGDVQEELTLDQKLSLARDLLNRLTR